MVHLLIKQEHVQGCTQDCTCLILRKEPCRINGFKRPNGTHFANYTLSVRCMCTVHVVSACHASEVAMFFVLEVSLQAVVSGKFICICRKNLKKLRRCLLQQLTSSVMTMTCLLETMKMNHGWRPPACHLLPFQHCPPPECHSPFQTSWVMAMEAHQGCILPALVTAHGSPSSRGNLLRQLISRSVLGTVMLPMVDCRHLKLTLTIIPGQSRS